MKLVAMEVSRLVVTHDARLYFVFTCHVLKVNGLLIRVIEPGLIRAGPRIGPPRTHSRLVRTVLPA